MNVKMTAVLLSLLSILQMAYGLTVQTIYCNSSKTTTGTLGAPGVAHLMGVKSPNVLFEIDYGYTWDINISTCNSTDNVVAYLVDYDGIEIPCEEATYTTEAPYGVRRPARENSFIMYKDLPGHDDFDLVVVSEDNGADFDVAVKCMQHEESLVVTEQEVVDIFTVVFPILMGVIMLIFAWCLVCLKTDNPTRSLYLAIAESVTGVLLFLMGMGTFGDVNEVVVFVLLAMGAALILYSSCIIANMNPNAELLSEDSRDESLID